jgi:hypothetical protein
MASLRQILFALAIPASLVACGGGDDGLTPPSGPHYGYVADTVVVPRNNSEAREIGLDLNGDKTVDNQLGMVLGTLAGQGFDVQTTLNEAVDSGSIVLLLDLQTPDFASTTGAGLRIKLGDGDTAVPAPCTDPDVLTTCGKHLEGTGSFMIAAGSPADAGVDGKIAGGVFTGGPGEISLQIALADADPIDLNLIGARAKATGITETGIAEVILAGAITQAQLDSEVIPNIQAQLPPIIAEDCTDLATPPDCGCMANSTGDTIISLFDTTPKDCAVTVEEIKTNSLIQSLLAPDVTIDGQDALSLGLSVSTVSATFPGLDAKRGAW